jgi:hypothetical protein
VTREQKMLQLADHVDVLVRYCSVHMDRSRVHEYYDGANAFWALCHMLAGSDEKANEMIAKIGVEGRHSQNPPDQN